MNQNVLADLLQQTLDLNGQQNAVSELDRIKISVGFCPGILQIVMNPNFNLAIRQAGVVYVKNLISNSWSNKDSELFTLSDQDKNVIRSNIIEAAVMAPEVIRVQLAVSICMIIRHDFPLRWPDAVKKISIYLQTPEPENWPGALIVLYQLVKNYEYKKKEDRTPLHEAMNLLLPQIYEIAFRSMNDKSQEITLVRKIILKIYFALTQYVLPLELINREVFTNWMEVLRLVLEQDIPPEAQMVEKDGKTVPMDNEDRLQLIWWKEKKWVMHILTRFFERYGSPGNVATEYKDFSEWYLKTFSQGILTSIFKIFDAYRRGTYISPRVMQKALNYVTTGVSHATSWFTIKSHIGEIIKDVVFPLMSYTEADAELWDSDPYEYVRVKFDIFEDFVSPVSAAQTLLHSVCKKRKDVLPKTMGMLMGIVQDGANTTPSQKDGALHMIGTMADILLKKKIYKEQMEQFLVAIVFPEFNSPHGHLRARACWMLHYFADVKYKNPMILDQSFKLTIASLLKKGEEVPVKVEAAIALQMMLTSQGDGAKVYVEPQIREITIELLNIIRETENDDLTSVMQKIVCTYTEQLTPVAKDMCKHLVDTFAQVVESTSDQGDEKAITAMGLLNTMETILTVMEDKEEVHAELEPIVLQAVRHIFSNSIMEFYEEALSLTCDLTTTKISDNMWEVLADIYNVFERDGLDYFTDMMPALHNYVTVDTDRFLSRREYPMALFNMSKKLLLDADPGEDPECHAAKLLEVIILQCKGKNIDELIPQFLDVVFTRLNREIKTSELRTMCLQVAIAAMYYDASVFFNTLQNRANQAGSNQDASVLIKNFIAQWIHDTDCFIGLHDRKLCVLGLCQIMTMPTLPGIEEFAPRILPSLILLFDGLKRAYEAQKDADDSDDSDSETDDDYDTESELLGSDEDEVDEKGSKYLENLEARVHAQSNGAVQASIEDDSDFDDSDDEDYTVDESSLDSYTTPIDDEENSIDEYLFFKETLQQLESNQHEWYSMLINSLNEKQKKDIENIFVLGNQRKEAKESKKIEQAGGYQFNNQSVPGQFNFANSGFTSPFGK